MAHHRRDTQATDTRSLALLYTHFARSNTFIILSGSLLYCPEYHRINVGRFNVRSWCYHIYMSIITSAAIPVTAFIPELCFCHINNKYSLWKLRSYPLRYKRGLRCSRYLFFSVTMLTKNQSVSNLRFITFIWIFNLTKIINQSWVVNWLLCIYYRWYLIGLYVRIGHPSGNALALCLACYWHTFLTNIRSGSYYLDMIFD